jgi:hypothetical protein
LFSCAHEIGHHQFGHGTKTDEYLAEGQSPTFSNEEFLANSFASHLLMPRATVMDAFQRRQWNAQRPTSQQIYLISGELGVGYETLVTHMCLSLDLISEAERDRLVKVTPKALKLELTGEPAIRQVVVVDLFWRHVAPIDAECGDALILPESVGSDCPLLMPLSQRGNGSIYLASRSGQAELAINGFRVPLRVARQHYVGPYMNRYLPDPDEH